MTPPAPALRWDSRNGPAGAFLIMKIERQTSDFRGRVDSFAWRRELVRTLLERDLPQLGVGVPAAALLRFWSMLAHYHGGVWNAAEFARSLGVSEPTVRRYLDLLSGLYMVRQLPPWHANIGKRQVKSPHLALPAPSAKAEVRMPCPAAKIVRGRRKYAAGEA